MYKTYIPIDLHCHSTHSDGSLTVEEVLNLAKQNGGIYQALTDHDTVDGINEARSIAAKLDLNLIPGVEISVTWHANTLIHIVGLGVDEKNAQLSEQLQLLRSSRLIRGKRIGDNLAKAGVPGAFEGALALCKNPQALSRTHFSQFLVNNGYAKPGKAFEKFLAPGKPGYTPQIWASLKDAVSWITQSGGIAVIAHPGRYKFTRTKLLKLIEEFKEYGGQGIEVISSSHAPSDEENIAQICKQTGLFASVGSDFHQEESYRIIKPGKNRALPNSVEPVFKLLGIDQQYY
ncbi:MAG: PHP domain-containing protein [Neisseriales bacterium]|nr:MAG: PHP domain-containing protein [Neisseriales bacterium]